MKFSEVTFGEDGEVDTVTKVNVLPQEEDDWRVGPWIIDPRFMEFTFFAIIFIVVCFTAVVNLTLEKNVSVWGNLLTFSLGVLVKKPKLPKKKKKK